MYGSASHYADYRQPREAPRTRDLRQALHSKNGHCTNGNHRVEVDEPLWPQAGYPDLQKCQSCTLWLACNAACEAQPPNELFGRTCADNTLEKEVEKYPCLRFTQRIRFYYHGTCILTYDVLNHRVTDHGTYGWSVTTSRAIHWDLEALRDAGDISPQRCEKIYVEMRKNRRGRTDINAPWYVTR